MGHGRWNYRVHIMKSSRVRSTPGLQQIRPWDVGPTHCSPITRCNQRLSLNLYVEASKPKRLKLHFWLSCPTSQDPYEPEARSSDTPNPFDAPLHPSRPPRLHPQPLRRSLTPLPTPPSLPPPLFSLHNSHLLPLLGRPRRQYSDAFRDECSGVGALESKTLG